MKKAMGKLTDKLRFSRIKDLAELDPEELLAVQADSALGAELQLNRLLSHACPGAWTAPGREQQLTKVEQLAMGKDKPSQLRSPFLTALPWSYALIGLLLGALVLLALAILLFPRQSSWAMSEGHLIELEVEFETQFTGTALDANDHPLLVLEDIVNDWAANDISVLGSDFQPKVRITSIHCTQGMYTARIQVDVFSADQDQLSVLIKVLTDLPGLVSIPKTYSQRWYYHEKYPTSYYPGRRFIINGTPYQYPQDFAESEQVDLRSLMFASPTEQNVIYFANLPIGNTDRFKLAEVVSVRMAENGDILLEDYAESLDLKGLQLPSFAKKVMVIVSAREVHLNYDPLELLWRDARSLANRMQSTDTSISPYGYRLVFNLLDEQKWQNVLATELPRILGEGDLAAAQSKQVKLENALAQFTQRYPELDSSGSLSALLATGVIELEGIPVQWQATLWWHDQRLIEELQAVLEKAGIPLLRFTPVIGATRSAFSMANVNLELVPFVRRYNLVPLDRKSDTDRAEPAAEYFAEPKQGTELADEFSAEEIQELDQLTDQLYSVYRTWQNELSPAAATANTAWPFRGFSVDRRGGVALHVQISIWDATEDQIEQLLDQLASVPGAPAPSVSWADDLAEVRARIEQVESRPKGRWIQYPTLPRVRYGGLTSSEIRKQLSADELAEAREKVLAIEQAHDQWRSSHPDWPRTGVTYSIMKDAPTFWPRSNYSLKPDDIVLGITIVVAADDDELAQELESELANATGISADRIIPMDVAP